LHEVAGLLSINPLLTMHRADQLEAFRNLFANGKPLSMWPRGSASAKQL
jgi:hypothetical protein